MTAPLASIGVSQAPDGSTVATLAGEVDASNVSSLERRLMALMSGASKLTLDLNELTYLDSQGARMLHHLVDHHFDVAVELVIAAAPRTAAHSLLTILCLDQVVPLVDRAG